MTGGTDGPAPLVSTPFGLVLMALTEAAVPTLNVPPLIKLISPPLVVANNVETEVPVLFSATVPTLFGTKAVSALPVIFAPASCVIEPLDVPAVSTILPPPVASSPAGSPA